jgi:hypothetical protein
MKSQQEKLEEFDTADLLWATHVYDELMQDILQNFLLFKYGLTPVLFLNSGDRQMTEFNRLKEHLFLIGAIKENELRASVIELIREIKE